MNSFSIIKIAAVILAISVVWYFCMAYTQEKMDFWTKCKICCIGFVANFLDTIGVGSFAVIIALRKLLGVMPDEVKLIGSMNIQAVITSVVQALLFLQLVVLDIWTLIVAIVMITLGGALSSFIVIDLKKQLISRIMLVAFCLTGIILFLTQLDLLTFNTNNTSIYGWKLLLFAIFMFIAGTLPAFGVGYYSLVKASIFLFGVNPIIAFPIMASASAYQMPVTALVFIKKRKFYSLATALLALSGTVGVFIAVPLITLVNAYTLKWILFAVVVYNIISILKETNNHQL